MTQKIKFPLNQFKSPEAQAAFEVCKILNQNQWIAFLAGGCVRDAYLKRPIRDFDVATSAPPEVVENLFSDTKPIGKEFGTILVLQNGFGIEVTTFRADGGYIDGRRPQSITWVDAEQDALRRDFTINALFYDPMAEEIIDSVGGMSDLDLRILRFVGQPELRIQEDHLRILRGIRFLIELGFAMEHNTSRAIMDSVVLIKKLSVERIFSEFDKLVKSQEFSKWQMLFDFKIFEILADSKVKLVGPPEAHFEVNPWLVFIQWLCKIDLASANSFFKNYVKSRALKVLFENYLKSQDPGFFSREGKIFEFAFDPDYFEILKLSDHPYAIRAVAVHRSYGGIKPTAKYKASDFPLIKGSQLGAGLRELYWRQLEGHDDILAEAQKIMLKA